MYLIETTCLFSILIFIKRKENFSKGGGGYNLSTPKTTPFNKRSPKTTLNTYKNALIHRQK